MGFAEINVGSLQIWDIKFFVVLFVGCFEDDLLFELVDFKEVGLNGVWQVSNSPLERLEGVFSHEHWLYLRNGYCVARFDKNGDFNAVFDSVTDFIFPFRLFKV
jgi:hypothetical protein